MMIQLSLHKYLFCGMGSYTRIFGGFDCDGKLAYNELGYEGGQITQGREIPIPIPY